MVLVGKLLLLSSTILGAALGAPIEEPKAAGGDKPFQWMWNDPPLADYLTTRSVSCSTGGTELPNKAGIHDRFKSVTIYSSATAITGVNIIYHGPDGTEKPVAYGNTKTSASETLTISPSQWIYDVVGECKGEVLSYLAFTTSTGKIIQAGSKARALTAGDEDSKPDYKSDALYSIAFASKDGGLSFAKPVFSEVEGDGDDAEAEAISYENLAGF